MRKNIFNFSMLAILILGSFVFVASEVAAQSCTPPASGCGGTDQWSCISGQCRAPVCGDGICNDCSLAFSPCTPRETNNTCPQDCAASPSPTPSPSQSGTPLPSNQPTQSPNTGDSNIPVLQTGQQRGIDWQNHLYTIGWKGEPNGIRYFKMPIPCDGKKHYITSWTTDLWDGLFADFLFKKNGVPTQADMESAKAIYGRNVTAFSQAMQRGESVTAVTRHAKLPDGKDSWYISTFGGSGGQLQIPEIKYVKQGSAEEQEMKNKGALLQVPVNEDGNSDFNFYFDQSLLQCGDIVYVMVSNLLSPRTENIGSFTNKLDLSYNDSKTNYDADPVSVSSSNSTSNSSNTIQDAARSTSTNIAALRRQIQDLMAVLRNLIARLQQLRASNAR